MLPAVRSIEDVMEYVATMPRPGSSEIIH
jgi:hypothetical protein